MMILNGHLPKASLAPSLLVSVSSEYLSIFFNPHGVISAWR